MQFAWFLTKTFMIEDFAIPNDVWEAALKVSNYAKQQGWSDDWCIADVCSRDMINKLRAEVAQWKANHDNQVKLKSILIQRPDLGDRAERIQKLINENSAYKAEYEKLKSICLKIYYARIAMREDLVIEGLKEIDKYFYQPNMN
jgi:allantoicase